MEGLRRRGPATWFPLLLFLLLRSFDFCSSISDEGTALLRFRKGIEVDPYDGLSNWIAEEHVEDPCAWRGVNCEDGKVVSLILKDLHLKGTLAPELGQLSHLRYLILRSNSFHGAVPREMGELQNLEVLDLAHNNLSGVIPSNLGNIPSLQLLMIGGNPLLDNAPPELRNLFVLSDVEVDYEPERPRAGSIPRRVDQAVGPGGDSIDQQGTKWSSPPLPIRNREGSNTPSPSAPPPSKGPSAPPPNGNSSKDTIPSPQPSPAPNSTISRSAPPPPGNRSKDIKLGVILGVAAAAVGGAVLVAVGIFCYRSNKVVAVKPWATGLSGQLQKAFVTGVTQLGRPELEAACEDFSNIIGTLSDCTLYKGTLSSGVEIAVASTVVNSAKDWSELNEAQFRKKIGALSKVNHKNFSNLLGYCEEEEPFMRMMVFEYAPNGTLHELLHVREAEDLDWAKRLRIMMGIAYCLDHMQQLTSPVVLGNLSSSSIYLTDDFAAKVSDFEFWSETATAEPPPAAASTSGPLAEHARLPELHSEEVVFKFGMLLLEIISGRPPVLTWASDHLKGVKPVVDLVDGNLKSFKEEDVAAICEVIVDCCKPVPAARPAMEEVAARLRAITGLAPEAATPKASPLWWAELEIISSES